MFNYGKFWAKQESAKWDCPSSTVERWKKLGKLDGAEIVKLNPKLFRDPGRTLRAEKLIHDTAVAVMKEFRLQGGKTGYVQDPTENQALLGADDQLINAEIIKGLAAASRVRLNCASYAYAKSLGAHAKCPKHQTTDLKISIPTGATKQIRQPGPVSPTEAETLARESSRAARRQDAQGVAVRQGQLGEQR